MQGRGRENLNLGGGHNTALGAGGNAGLCTPNFRAGPRQGTQGQLQQQENAGFLAGFPSELLAFGWLEKLFKSMPAAACVM